MIAKKEYYYGLDQLRALLMLIGVLTHAASVISPFYQWNYHSERYQDALIHNIVHVTHFFRVEAFFLIAGFFSAMVLVKKGKRYFLKGRYLRVLMPLVFSILLINSFEVWFVVHHNITAWENISIGSFIVHSWFLLTLMIISLICLLPIDKFFSYLNGFNGLVKAGLFIFYMYLPFGIKFVLNMFVSMTDHPLFYSLYSYFIEKTLYYSIYFFIGYIIYRNEVFRGFFNKKSVKAVLWVITIAGLSYQTLTVSEGRENLPFVMRAINVFIQHASAISVSLLLFDFFFTASFPPSRAVAFFVRSAIIVYLFHHPVLIVFGYYFDVPGMTPFIYFMLLVTVGYLLSFISYLIVNGTRFTRFMFGLK
ncbi:acyltransferase [Actinobacillus succinogenes]|uniref:Acyltransferase 3 n=1 Tax=Actinobacillus succinogenes (strain ATCC 55618 / DSM 22257 / CCUG 43843 / 130Z) TaxID=339671 RepID=A6VMB7_ACTSZ|nr:acyltransferase family protein [Actinobacillus succinogenes]ABR74114.1 acyltransferase 3 [Actinobacillus succinogenes 130Z]PHI39453.1 acyltransferase [Actinobacillus succinogenes]